MWSGAECLSDMPRELRVVDRKGNPMTRKLIPVCGEHHTQKEWRMTTFEYHDDGIVIHIPNVLAWVCPQDSEASFTPDITDELIATVRELIETAKRAKQRRSTFTEYIVAVGG